MFDGETIENHCFWGSQNLRNRSCRLSAYEDIIGTPFCLLRFVESSKALPVENLKCSFSHSTFLSFILQSPSFPTPSYTKLYW